MPPTVSPSLFNPFLEFVMKDLQILDSGIQMGDMRINNIRYADDTTLMDLVFEKLEISTNELEKACSRWGMKINPSKFKIMSQDKRHITLNDAIINKVDDFVFLGSNVPSVVADVKRRTRLAAWAFGRLKNAIWTNQDITRSLKVRIYRAESWTLCQADKRQLDTFEMRCLRVILGVSLMDKIRDEEIRQRLHLPTTICDEVSKRRLKWFGHVVRMPPHILDSHSKLTRMTFSN